MGQILMYKNRESYVYLLLFYYLLPYTTIPVRSETVTNCSDHSNHCKPQSKLGEIRLFKYVNYDELGNSANVTNNSSSSTEAFPITSTDRSLIPNSFFSTLNVTKRTNSSKDGDLETSASNVSERPRRSPHRHLPGNTGFPRAPLYRATQPAPALSPTSYAYQTGPTAYYDYDYGISSGASAASPPEEPSYNYPRFRRPPRPAMGNRVRVPQAARRRPAPIQVPRPPRPVPRPIPLPRPHRNVAQSRPKLQGIPIPAAPQYSYPRDAANIQDILNYFTNDDAEGQKPRPRAPMPQPLPSSAPDFSSVSLGSDFSKELHDVQTSLLKDIREFARRPSIMGPEHDNISPGPPMKSGSLDHKKRIPPPSPSPAYYEHDDELDAHEEDEPLYEKPKPVRELIKPKHKYGTSNSRERHEESRYGLSREDIEQDREIKRKREKQKERERMREIERDKERERMREIERDKEREREKERERAREIEREKERERAREKERERAREIEREKAREEERKRVREIEREKAREKERERAREIEREKERERERKREMEKERIRKIQRERDRSREKKKKPLTSSNEEDYEDDLNSKPKKLSDNGRNRESSQERLKHATYEERDQHDEPSHEINNYYETKAKSKPKYAPPPSRKNYYESEVLSSYEERDRKQFANRNQSPSTSLVLKRPYGPYRPPNEAIESAEYRRRFQTFNHPREREPYKPDLYLRPPPTPQESSRYNSYKPPTGMADIVEIHTNPPYHVDVRNRENEKLKERNDRLQKLYLDYLERKLEAESALNTARPSTLAPTFQHHPMTTKKPMRMKIHIYPNSKSDQEELPPPLSQPPVDHPKYKTNNNPYYGNFPYQHPGVTSFQASPSYSAPVRNDNIPVLKSGPGPDGYRLKSNLQHRHYVNEPSGGQPMEQNFGDTTRQQLDSKNKNLVLHLHVHRRSDGGMDLNNMEGSEIYTSTVKPLTYKDIYDGHMDEQTQQLEEDHNNYQENQRTNSAQPENKISMEVPIQDEKIGDVLTTLLKFREK